MFIKDMQKEFSKILIIKIQVIIMTCMFKVITLLLTDVFENFRNKCIEIYELDTCTWISMASMFKENRSKTRIVN